MFYLRQEIVNNLICLESIAKSVSVRNFYYMAPQNVAESFIELMGHPNRYFFIMIVAKKINDCFHWQGVLCFVFHIIPQDAR